MQPAKPATPAKPAQASTKRRLAAAAARQLRFVVIQGTFYVQRRRYAELFACVEKLLAQGHADLRLVLLGKSVPGRALSIPRSIQNHTIVQSDKGYEDYYSTLLAADVLVSFAHEGFSYMVNRSTSSVTMGVLCELPLALPAKMLGKYPCIREQPWHRNVTAGGDDCAALEAAVRLSGAQLLAMKHEVRHCKDAWLSHGHAVIEEFAQRPLPSADNGTERYKRQCWDLVMKSTVS